MDALETIKVSSRGQIVIPEEVRKDLGIKEGTKLILIEDNGKIVLEKEEDFLKNYKEQQERMAWSKLSEESLKRTWDNEKDEAAAKWYEEQAKKGAYDEYNNPSKK